MLGYTMSGAPLALKDRVIVAPATGEAGIPGWIKAFDPATGRELWNFNIIPKPGEKGNETWAGDSWKYGGGGSWLTPSYDAETNTIIAGTGNPVPDFNPDLRKGDDLYSDCVIGLDADTGKLKFYYQFTPNDPHDWDSTEDMVLADQVIDGKPRKLILHADRNGLFYVLDRTNGKFIFAKPFARQTWNLGFDKNGRPIVDPKSLATATGQVVYPAIGATNFEAPSYDSQSKMLFLTYNELAGFAISAPAANEPGKQYLGRGTGTPPPAPPPVQGVEAIDTTTGAIRWRYPVMQQSLQAGVVATRSGLVFAATGEGQLIALEAATGKPLWHFRTGQRITASPMSYAVDGQQFVAVSSGNMIFSFALPQ
jgi:alcohol dehydrogenase (cytochrome c)